MSTRKARGRRTEAVLAERLRPLFPNVQQVNSGTSGADLLNTPGLAFEVKARSGLDLAAWMRQASRNAREGEIPALAIRLNGMGEGSVDNWPVVLPLSEFVLLLRKAGYGSDDGNPR